MVLGCGSAELTVVIPGDEFLPQLAGMQKTEEDRGRSYWHVELFGNRTHLELGQSLLNTRIAVTQLLVR